MGDVRHLGFQMCIVNMHNLNILSANCQEILAASVFRNPQFLSTIVMG